MFVHLFNLLRGLKNVVFEYVFDPVGSNVFLIIYVRKISDSCGVNLSTGATAGYSHYNPSDWLDIQALCCLSSIGSKNFFPHSLFKVA